MILPEGGTFLQPCARAGAWFQGPLDPVYARKEIKGPKIALFLLFQFIFKL